MELFPQVFSGFTGELRILSNIEDGAFCKNSQKRKAVGYFCKNLHGCLQGSDYLPELAYKVTDVSFLNKFEYQRLQITY